MYGKCRDGVARGQIPYELGKCAGNLYSMCFNRDLVEWNGPLNLSVKNDVIIISPKLPPKPELGVHMTVDQPDVIDHQERLALQGSSSAFEQVPATHAYPTGFRSGRGGAGVLLRRVGYARRGTISCTATNQGRVEPEWVRW